MAETVHLTTVLMSMSSGHGYSTIMHDKGCPKILTTPFFPLNKTGCRISISKMPTYKTERRGEEWKHIHQELPHPISPHSQRLCNLWLSQEQIWKPLQGPHLYKWLPPLQRKLRLGLYPSVEFPRSQSGQQSEDTEWEICRLVIRMGMVGQDNILSLRTWPG